MVCGNAAGYVAPPYINYKSEKIWSTWMQNGPSGARYNRTKSGRFDGNTFEDWFSSLLLPILKRQDGCKAIIGDNLSSHINIEVLRLCEENNIKFIALSPNATHLLQPLDVAYFRPMKGAWRNVLKEWKQTAAGSRCKSVPKDQFPLLLKKMWDRLHTSSDNLIAGFRKSGIYPIDRQQVLKRLPSHSLDSSVSSVVGETFLEEIMKKREEITKGHQKTGRKKLNVSPGKSISAEEIEAGATSEPQPSTSRGTHNKPKQKRTKKERSSSDDSIDLCLDDTDDSITALDNVLEEFSRQSDDEFTRLTSLTRNTPNVQNLTVEQYVLVEYEGALYPGQITEIKNDDEILIMTWKNLVPTGSGLKNQIKYTTQEKK